MIYVATMWDDGLVSDLKLIEILHKLGATATFAISPSKHRTVRQPNDLRGDYGFTVSENELKEFAPFEICNHTNNHIDLKKVPLHIAKDEILLGKEKLEQIFSRKIYGFCYPYGVYTQPIVDFLKSHDFSYARTTLSSRSFGFNNPMLIHPTCRWNELDKLSLPEEGKLILWGHTYELKTEAHWKSVEDFYKMAINTMKLVSFNELVSL